MSILHRQGSQTIYRLLYPYKVTYFLLDKNKATLLDMDGKLHNSNELKLVTRKVKTYERLFSKSIPIENLSNLLRLDEVKFLLDELNINNLELEAKLANRLYSHLNQSYVKRFHQPLMLGKLLTRHEFVTNYLQSNIGLPDNSDNYYNKLREMIEQIEEQTAYVQPDYFKVIQSLLMVVNQNYPDKQTVIVATPFSSCIVKTGTDLLPINYHHFITKPNLPFQTVVLNNDMLYQLIQTYQELEYTRQ